MNGGVSLLLSSLESRLLTLYLDVFCAIIVTLVLLVHLFVRFFSKQSWRPQLQYEDRDGIGALNPSAEWLIRSFAVLFTAAALTTSVFENVNGSTNASWANTAAWTSALALTVLFASAALSTKRFYLGLVTLACFVPVIATEALRLYLQSWHVNADAYTSNDISLSLYRLILAVLTCFLLASVRRRPVLFREGRPVDDENGTSLFSRLTFAWATDTLWHAWKSGRLEEADLRHLSYRLSSAHLSSSFTQTAKKPASLWYLLIKDHFDLFSHQSGITLLHSFVMFGPTFALQRLLRLLESRTAVLDSSATVWAIVMVATIVLGGFTEAWESWINWGHLEIAVRSQLYTLIFEKCLKLEDIKSPEGADDDNEDDEDDDSDEEDGDKATQSKTKSTKKNVINMLGVDVDRVAAFAAENTQLTGCLFQFAIGMVFLASVLGWQSTLAGLVVPILFFPIHRWTSTRYGDHLAAMMEIRDQKSHVVTEVLHAIKQIKFSASEDQWQDVIMKARQKEIDIQWTLFLDVVGMTFAWEGTPIFLGAVSLTTYSLLNGSLSASTAFTAVSLLTTLQFTVSVIPVIVSELIQARVSSNRIQEHLGAQEKDDYASAGTAIEFKKATLAWSTKEESEEAFSLVDLNLKFPQNSLSIITGKTGSGKSLLLAGLVGEAALKSGQLFKPESANESSEYDTDPRLKWILKGTQAYVAQVPFLENASIRDNIIWGLPLDTSRYQLVVNACAFASDIAMFEDKDETEIGATGVNLSGGQRWRLTLARALYSRAEILILDDIFSAVDAHVARHILEQAIDGDVCRDRTIILATHHSELASSRASYLVHLADGTATTQEVTAVRQEKGLSPDALAQPQNDPQAPKDQVVGEVAGDKKPRKFVEDEERDRGSVKFSVYAAYLSASGGYKVWALILLSYISATGIMLYRSYVVKQWTSNPDPEAVPLDKSSQQAHNMRFLLLYIGISILSTILVSVKILTLSVGALKASKTMFRNMTTTVLRAPMRWLERTPTGRLLNRFVGDFEDVDISMFGNLSWFMNDGFALITVLAAALLVSVWMGLPILVLVLFAVLIAIYYLPGAREMKRLDSVARSPIFDLFNVMLSGLATIRTFEKTDQYVTRMQSLIDIYASATWHQHLVTSWMELRQGLLGAVFVAAILAIVLTRDIEASLAGFVLSFAMDFTETLVTVVRTYSNLELDMNATERIVEYTNLEREGEKGVEPDADWPTEGRLTIKNLEVAYAEDLPPVLKDISLSIQPHERVGVVGRTGSGKSTLVLALFRFLQQRQGSIEIDGVDIGDVTLPCLRKRLSIIPQDPVLFTGTLRSNLDPFNLYTDEDLKDVLRQVNLFSKDAFVAGSEIASAEDGSHTPTGAFTTLDHQVSRGGLNISQGQRQLVCLARAMLSQPKVMLLDEATSAVDMETDALIQRSLRERFMKSTLIVIAHRLSTVIDFDKILVMGDGKVVEFGRPAELYRQDGQLASMVRGSGESARLIEEMMKKSDM